jgi:hypothetical protein
VVCVSKVVVCIRGGEWGIRGGEWGIRGGERGIRGGEQGICASGVVLRLHRVRVVLGSRSKDCASKWRAEAASGASEAEWASEAASGASEAASEASAHPVWYCVCIE